jgi:D-aminoacyl-tRNA deacylase
MRVVIQRVQHATCTVSGKITGSCGHGYCLFVGFNDEDTEEIIDKMIHKILFLRIFEDESGKMNQSILDISGSILSISQFTLYANCKKGNRPSFTDAGKPEYASRLFDVFNEKLKEQIPCETGIFGADMKIDLLNDGPVTIVLDSKEIF